MRLARTLALVVAGIAIVVVAAFRVPLPLVVVAPGGARSLADRLTIDGQPAEIDGDYLFTTIAVTEATLAQAIGTWFDPETTAARRSRYIPAGIDPSLYIAQQQGVFAAEASTAAGVGLDLAGIEVDFEQVRNGGLLVVVVEEGAPSEGALQPGDVIVGAGSREYLDREELKDATQALDDGDALALDVVRVDGAEETVDVVPAASPEDGRPYLGILVEELADVVELPREVTVANDIVGGPSAGLLTALAVYDAVDVDVDLAAGRLVSGTGVVDAEGAVLGVGGIAEKVRSAVAAGADVFLVPAGMLDEAEDALPGDSDMQVVGVRDVEEAVDALGEGGG